MKVLAEGCELCEPLVAPHGPCEGEHHKAIRLPETIPWNCLVLCDGERADDCTEVWAGTPGRVIRIAADSVAHVCPCQPGWKHDFADDTIEVVEVKHGIFAQLIEYDSVEIQVTSPSSRA